ncbi:MAG: DegT/DnrJ/EryC1/StrS family aminotransferase [Kiritimatiellia bacterium]
MNVIPHSRPSLGEEEAAAAAEVVRSGWLKGGPRREELERVIAADQGFAHALAVTSCTQAVHLALRARFPEGGARVVLPAYICRSVWDAVKLAGCEPVLVDSCEADLGPSLEATLTQAPEAVIVAHLAGIRAPVEGFLGRGLFVIEDCAQRIQPGTVRRAPIPTTSVCFRSKRPR